MNTDYIAFCSKHYESTLDEADKARLHFFEGLWAVMRNVRKTTRKLNMIFQIMNN